MPQHRRRNAVNKIKQPVDFVYKHFIGKNLELAYRVARYLTGATVNNCQLKVMRA